jgi:hypothetical protein
MRNRRIIAPVFTAVAAAALVLTTCQARADVQPTPTPAPGEAEASPSDVVADVGTSVPPCCTKPCISYRHHRRCRRHCCCDCRPPVSVVLQVVDPCRSCYVEVPVCLPACCGDTPTVCSRRGLFGRRIVDYSWCCGYHIKVVFRRCGDLIVHCYGS